MEARIANISLRQGRDFLKTYEVFTVNSDGSEILRDISAWEITAEIRVTQNSGADLLGTFVIAIDTINSIITLSLTDTVTQIIPEGIWYYDILVTIAGYDQTYIEGNVTVYGGATKV